MSMSTNGIGGPHITQGQEGFKIPIEGRVRSKQNTDNGQAEKKQSQDVTHTDLSTKASIAKTIQYNIDDRLDQVVVKVIDPATNETVREIPTVEMQEMKIRIKDAIGNFIDETV